MPPQCPAVAKVVTTVFYWAREGAESPESKGTSIPLKRIKCGWPQWVYGNLHKPLTWHKTEKTASGSLGS